MPNQWIPQVFSENSSCLKHILAALGKIIGAQDPDAFSSSGLQRVLKPVLEATVDTSPKGTYCFFLRDYSDFIPYLLSDAISVRKAALEGIHDAFFPFSVGGATVPQVRYSQKSIVWQKLMHTM